jgi:hypothetical protein
MLTTHEGRVFSGKAFQAASASTESPDGGTSGPKRKGSTREDANDSANGQPDRAVRWSAGEELGDLGAEGLHRGDAKDQQDDPSDEHKDSNDS